MSVVKTLIASHSEATVTVALRVPKKLHIELVDACRRLGVSRLDFVCAALQDALIAVSEASVDIVDTPTDVQS